MQTPSAAQYKRAFLAIQSKMHSKHFKMLQANYAAPNHTISVADLAKAVESPKAFLAYGRLGSLLCEKLGYTPTMQEHGKPVVTQVLADKPSGRTTASWEWTLRPQVVKALEELGWANHSEASDVYILTWNPISSFSWDTGNKTFEWFVRQTAIGKRPNYVWSTGNRKNMKKGDRLFLFRQGDNRGLIGSGYATSQPYPGKKGQRRFLVKMRFDTVLPVEEVVPVGDLERASLGIDWNALLASGVNVPSDSVRTLDYIWSSHLSRIGRSAVAGNDLDSIGAGASVDLDQDQREWAMRQIVQRRGQPEFREQLLNAYGGRCTVTGCDAKEALEAAHISPYSGSSSNCVPNGLLLRSDIHTLFDLGLIAIEPNTMKISIARELAGTEYDRIEGQQLRLPNANRHRPNEKWLARRWKTFRKRS